MEKPPLVSVIMPVYNAMPYLPVAVRSIFAQTVQDWELLLVDDGSTDDSMAWARRIHDPRVRVMSMARRGGCSPAINHGVTMARGKYIARMDADDLSLPRRLEVQIALLESRKDVDVIGCGMIKTTADLEPVLVLRPPDRHKDIIRLAALDSSLIHGPNFQLTGGTLMGRIEWFRKWPYTVNRYAEDFGFYSRVFRYSTFSNVRDPLYVYRRGGVTGSWWHQVLACDRKVRCILKHCFVPGFRSQAALAMANAMLLRPFTAGVVYTAAALLRTGDGTIGAKVSSADRALLAEALEQIRMCELPLDSLENAE